MGRARVTALRLVTFNTLHGRVAGSIASLRADVLALQEVDVRVRRSGFRDQADAAARATGMNVFFGPATRLGVAGRYGNALLTRGVIETARVLALAGSQEPRAAVVAEVVVDGVRLSVAATHLSHVRDEALHQLALVVAALGGMPAPRALLGDLNLDAEDVRPLVAPADLSLADAAAPTFPARGARIDHIAVAGLRFVDVEVPDTPVSDHRPVVATVAAQR